MVKENGPLKKTYIKLWNKWGKMTASSRSLPNYIIIGGQKAGSSILDQYIRQHPLVIPSFKKEVKYFGSNFHRGLNWYKSHFPKISKMKPEGSITGEASPYYIFHPLAPKRISETIPNVKLIALLRNPIDRAYSHYKMNVKRTRENRTFEKAIKNEIDFIQNEEERILNDDSYSVYNHKHFSYLSRGIYADQLVEWFKYFSRNQIHIIKSEDMFLNFSDCVYKTTEFLNLPNWKFTDNTSYNKGKYNRMLDSTRLLLYNFFKPHNERLNSLLNKNFGWDS